MTNSQRVNVAVEHLVYEPGRLPGGLNASPESGPSSTEREPQSELGNGCLACTRTCRTRDAIREGMQCGASRDDAGHSPSRA